MGSGHTDVSMKVMRLCFRLGEKVKLSLAAEEVAVFFAQMLDHDYTTKKVFRENFFKDWRKVRLADVFDIWFLSRPSHIRAAVKQ